MFVAIKDDLNEISIHVDSETEGYSPDVMDDLKTRALDTYRDTLITQAVVAQEVNK